MEASRDKNLKELVSGKSVTSDLTIYHVAKFGDKGSNALLYTFPCRPSHTKQSQERAT